MMKKRLALLTVATVIVLGIGIWSYRFSLFFHYITPRHAFNASEVPARPDYAQKPAWYSLPEQGSDDKVDVFFLHPTTLRSAKVWNEDIHHSNNSENFEWIERNIVSVFRDCCRIYAPYYRQATLAAYWAGEDGLKARQVAYEDVQDAFRHYMSHWNQGRPFIIAGHSQGSEMGIRLIEDHVLQASVRERLIAAYIIGISIPTLEMAKTHPGFPVCASATQTGCLINWTSFRREKDETYFRIGPNGWWTRSGYIQSDFSEYACVNPLDWGHHKELVSRENHRGMKIYQSEGKVIQLAQATTAQCGKDGLKLDNLDAYLPIPLEGNYHMYDYAIFHEDIKANLLERIRSFETGSSRTTP